MGHPWGVGLIGNNREKFGKLHKWVAVFKNNEMLLHVIPNEKPNKMKNQIQSQMLLHLYIYRSRCMLNCSELIPDNVERVVYACVILHNLLIARRPHEYLRKIAQQAQQPDNAEDLGMKS